MIKGIVQEIHMKTLGHRVTITTDNGNGPGKGRKKIYTCILLLNIYYIILYYIFANIE